MITYYLFETFKKDLILFTILDIIRDILLVLIVFIVFIYLLISGFKRNKMDIILSSELLLAIFLSTFLCLVIKSIHPEIRPISYFMSYYPQYFDSFPSKHTTIITSVTFVILYNNLEFGILLLILSFLMGILSWMSLQHWPIDIILGWFLGFLIAIFVIEFIKYLFRFYRNKRK